MAIYISEYTGSELPPWVFRWKNLSADLRGLS